MGVRRITVAAVAAWLLVGAGAAAEYARRGLTLAAGQRCGAHDARTYVARVATMQRRFRALART